MPIEPLWRPEGISPERRASLLEPFEFGTLIDDMYSELRNVRFAKDRGSHEARGSWRPVIRFDVGEQTFDRFFNSPYGYRGQFLISPTVGVEANSRVLAALAEPLVRLANLAPSLAEEASRSLLSQHAKIWIEEDQYTRSSLDLIIEILVPNWVTAAIAIRKRLDQHDSSLTNKEIDRIFGVRAPTGNTLKVMGAWIGSNGSLTVVPSKLSRAEEINRYGIS
jgi:hypothetical protein